MYPSFPLHFQYIYIVILAQLIFGVYIIDANAIHSLFPALSFAVPGINTCIFFFIFLVHYVLSVIQP